MPIFTPGKFGFGSGGAGASASGTPKITSASGGTKTTVGAYTVHKFTSPGTFTVSTGSAGDVEVFMVGGGGAGGSDSGGGGGGGEVLIGTNISYSPGPYAVVVGEGGEGAASYVPDSTPAPDWGSTHGGESSTLAHPGGSIISYGGNCGGSAEPSGEGYAPGPMTPGNSGNLGSGGGANQSSPNCPGTTCTVTAPALNSISPARPGSGTWDPHRNKGGDAVKTNPSGAWIGGGGGGAGGEGGNGTNQPGAGDGGQGGVGYNASTNIAWLGPTDGASGYFAGGGGGGAPDSPGGSGGAGEGLHGGGDGKEGSGAANGGTANTGGGGGGDDDVGGSGDGGSGIVYIAYPT